MSGASLASSLSSLQSRVFSLAQQHPPLLTPWQSGAREELAGRALQAVEDVLAEAQETGELWLPRPGDRQGVAFHPCYGILPDPHNCRYTRVTQEAGEEGRFEKIVFVLQTMMKLIRSGTRTTKRDIFYDNFTVFGSQSEVDSVVAGIVGLVQVPRLLLWVMATSKGLVVGHLTYLTTEGVTVDCRLAAGGDSIPQDVSELPELRSEASFVLVVEKDAVFQRLLEEGVMTGSLPPCVMVTGKGVPDLATRQLVHLLATQCGLPVLLLTDCDPYGIEIALCYKFGSLAMAWAPERLAVPSSLWIGLLPSDIGKLGIPDTSMLAMSGDDFKKLQDLHCRQHIRDSCPALLAELEVLWQLGRKAEIQQLSEDREPGYLAHSYIASKVAWAGQRAARGLHMF